jgi:hypothetical protein
MGPRIQGALLAVILTVLPTISRAQNLIAPFPPGSPGWAVVTFASQNAAPSGTGAVFDLTQPVVKVWDITKPGAGPLPAPAVPKVWPLPGFTPTVGSNFIWSGSNLGQVFGLALDDDLKGPYIYVTATAIYGSTTVPLDNYNSCPNCYPGNIPLSQATSASPPFSLPSSSFPPAGTFAGAPGSPIYGAVWRLSLNGGLSSVTYELIANIPNSNAMSLGQIAFNPDAQTFYVSNFADGMIYIFSKPAIGSTLPIAPTSFTTYDHGLTGRSAVGLPPIIDPTTSPPYLFTQYGRRVWGLQYNPADKRLYYAVWNSDYRNQGGGNNEIWSVALNAAGQPDPSGTPFVRKELVIPPHPSIPTTDCLPPSSNTNPCTTTNTYSQPVSDIAFKRTGDVMLLAERGERIGLNIIGGYDTSSEGNSTLPHSSRILRFNRSGGSGAPWQIATGNAYGEYAGDVTNNAPATDFTGYRTDSAGGVTFGYDYTLSVSGENTTANLGAPDGWVWNTVNSYTTLNSGRVYGFQGAHVPVPDAGPKQQLNTTTPFSDVYFINYNGFANTYSPKSMVGDIKVYQQNTGILKLCKVAGPGVAVGTQFSFSDGTSKITVPAGPVPGGYCVVDPSIFAVGTSVNVVETIPTGDGVSSIAVNGQPAPNPSSGTVNLTIGSGVNEVTFTDQVLTGYLEICKQLTNATPPASYTFSFLVTPGNLGTIVVPPNACLPAIQLPVGQYVIQELSDPDYPLVGCSALPASQQVGPCNLSGGSLTVNIAAGGISTQTIANFSDQRSRDPVPPPNNGGGTNPK